MKTIKTIITVLLFLSPVSVTTVFADEQPGPAQQQYANDVMTSMQAGGDPGAKAAAQENMKSFLEAVSGNPLGIKDSSTDATKPAADQVTKPAVDAPKVVAKATTMQPTSNNANAGSPAATPAIDPAIAFFIGLSTCTPGTYAENNILSDTFGPRIFKQHIDGPDLDVCNATLMTPDNRKLVCQFPMQDLGALTDIHFLEGMLIDTLDKPDHSSLNADMMWSDFKADYCNFDYAS